jgi:hypothetical protein
MDNTATIGRLSKVFFLTFAVYFTVFGCKNWLMLTMLVGLSHRFLKYEDSHIPVEQLYRWPSKFKSFECQWIHFLISFPSRLAKAHGAGQVRWAGLQVSVVMMCPSKYRLVHDSNQTTMSINQFLALTGWTGAKILWDYITKTTICGWFFSTKGHGGLLLAVPMWTCAAMSANSPARWWCDKKSHPNFVFRDLQPGPVDN